MHHWLSSVSPKHKIFFVILALCIGGSLFGVSIVTAATCTVPEVSLEIGIGNKTSILGLSAYIATLYKFIVGSVGIIATTVIVYHGFRWATAAGNQTVIGKSKEGIVSALIGVILAVTSYIVLFTINESFVSFPTICPEGLLVEAGELQTWETCGSVTTSESTECSGVDYCKSSKGCSCSKATGGSDALVCVPLADHELAVGTRCFNSDNCVAKSYCINGSTVRPGTCESVNYEASCGTDSDCDSPLSCIAGTYGKQCLPETGRGTGDFCSKDDDCTSGVCVESLDICQAGTTGASCGEAGSDDDCSYGFICDTASSGSTSGTACRAKKVDDECSEENACGDSLTCVDGTCKDGSTGSECETNADCTTGNYCVENDYAYGSSCLAGTESVYCDNSSDCDSGLYCYDESIIGDSGKCYDGTLGDFCNTSTDCDEGYCSSSDKCETVTEGSSCSSDDTCLGDLHCVTERPSTPAYCTDGSTGDWCDDDTDCESGSCTIVRTGTTAGELHCD